MPPQIVALPREKRGYSTAAVARGPEPLSASRVRHHSPWRHSRAGVISLGDPLNWVCRACPAMKDRRSKCRSGRPAMRIMIKFAFPVGAGNEAIRSGKMETVFHAILEELKPEAAYFFPEGGERTVVDMKESSQVAEIAER